jgi:UDP-N-acetyl-2-amino-2-deoxyglucuronate dehydrogenase
MNNTPYALIGLGRISRKHIEAAINNRLILSVAFDIDRYALIKSKLDNEFVNTVSNIEDFIKMLTGKCIIAIATDSESHISIARKLIRYGHHIIIEKPIGLGLESIDLLIADSLNFSESKITVSHQNRFNPAVVRLSDSLSSKNLGKIFYGVASIRWNRNKAYYDQAGWRGKWKSDGGALMNQSIHNIDLLLWMMDSPVVEVFGYIDNKNHPTIEVEDMGVALLKFANGSFGIIESSMNTYPENFEETLSIFGEKGTVVLGGKSVNKIVHWNVKDDPIDDLEKFNEEVDSVYGNGHIALYKDFIEAIEQDREPSITLQDGRNAVEVILAIYLSSFEKRPVQLPLPADTSTIMFEGKSFK